MPVLFVTALLILGALLMWNYFSNVLFIVEVHDGRATVTQGDVPPGMLHMMRDACRLGGMREGKIRAWKTEQGLNIRTTPRNEGVEQRLRNVAGTRRWTQYRAPSNPHLQTAKKAVVWTAVAALVSRAFRR